MPFFLLTLVFLVSACGNHSETSLSAVMDGPSPTPRISLSISGGKDYVQFNTKLSRFRNTPDSLRVRPAYPDTEQFIEVKNVSSQPLKIENLRIGIPQVTADLVLTESETDDVTLAPNQSKKIRLAYRPQRPNAQSFEGENFAIKSGILIFTSDDEDPLIPIEIRGQSTFNADVNYDATVSMPDLGIYNSSYGKNSASPNWDPTMDINGDGASNFNDLGVLNKEMGKTVSPLPKERKLRVGAIRSQKGYPDLIPKIDSLLAEHPDLDLILTPEYAFFSLGAVNLICGAFCRVESIGTPASAELVAAITSLQEKAARHRVNIVLGTVIAGVEVNHRYVYDNTALIISNEGKLIGHHRKLEMPYTLAPEVCKRDTPTYHFEECNKLERASMDTGYPVTLTNQAGEAFTVFAMICAELISYNPASLPPTYRDPLHYLSGEVILVERLRNTKVDLIAHSLASGDILTEYLTDCIQNGKDMTGRVCTLVKNQTQNLYLDKWKDQFGVLREGGAILTTDLASGNAGVLNTQLTPLSRYQLAPNYLFAEIVLP